MQSCSINLLTGLLHQLAKQLPTPENTQQTRWMQLEQAKICTVLLLSISCSCTGSFKVFPYKSYFSADFNRIRLAGWCLMALAAKIGYIKLWLFKTCVRRLWTGNATYSEQNTYNLIFVEMISSTH